MVHDRGNIDIILPLSVMTVSDVYRIEQDLIKADDFLVQSSMREGGKHVTLPRTNRLLEELASLNELNILDEADRKQLLRLLSQLRQHAPVLHFSFATDPSAAFLHKLTRWLRSNIHPVALVQVGLQPGIAAGCVLRTTNRYYDFSLRKHLFNNRNVLLDNIRLSVRSNEQ